MLIQQWLNDFKTLPEDEWESYSEALLKQQELLTALFDFLDNPNQEELLNGLCKQLFNFYKATSAPKLRLFSLSLLPGLVEAYLEMLRDSRISFPIETLLLAIYNYEVLFFSDASQPDDVPLPRLNDPSIYREPPPLFGLDERHVVVPYPAQPLPYYKTISSVNRMSVLTSLSRLYNAHIDHYSDISVQELCKMASHVCTAGFDNLDLACCSLSLGDVLEYGGGAVGAPYRSSLTVSPRIALHASFLLALLDGVEFALFSDSGQAALVALDDVHNRACYELFGDVLLVTNAIKNTVYLQLTAPADEQLLGLDVVAGHTITNATFKATKLPDDIDCIDGAAAGAEPFPPDAQPDAPGTKPTDRHFRNRLIRIGNITVHAAQRLRIPRLRRESVATPDKTHRRFERGRSFLEKLTKHHPTLSNIDVHSESQCIDEQDEIALELEKTQLKILPEEPADSLNASKQSPTMFNRRSLIRMRKEDVKVTKI